MVRPSVTEDTKGAMPPGTTLPGGYVIESFIARGGMGEVYRAADTTHGRRVAIKALQKGKPAQADLRARFRREMKLASQLEHPNIVPVFDVGLVGSVPFIVMEHLECPTIAQILVSHPKGLEEDRCISVMTGLCAALEYAHGQDVIHRDLKPGNIFVREDGQIALADFGLAHVAGATTITKTGQFMGSPIYMSPEVLRGERADHRADIYACGVILFELLTGSAPFTEPSFSKLAKAIMETPPPDPRRSRPHISDVVAMVVQKALSKDPDERFPTIAALRAALTSQSVTRGVVVEREASFRPSGITMAILLVLVLGGLTYGLFREAEDPWRETITVRAQTERAVLGFRAAREGVWRWEVHRGNDVVGRGVAPQEPGQCEICVRGLQPGTDYRLQVALDRDEWTGTFTTLPVRLIEGVFYHALAGNLYLDYRTNASDGLAVEVFDDDFVPLIVKRRCPSTGPIVIENLHGREGGHGPTNYRWRLSLATTTVASGRTLNQLQPFQLPLQPEEHARSNRKVPDDIHPLWLEDRLFVVDGYGGLNCLALEPGGLRLLFVFRPPGQVKSLDHDRLIGGLVPLPNDRLLYVFNRENDVLEAGCLDLSKRQDVWAQRVGSETEALPVWIEDGDDEWNRPISSKEWLRSLGLPAGGEPVGNGVAANDVAMVQVAMSQGPRACGVVGFDARTGAQLWTRLCHWDALSEEPAHLFDHGPLSKEVSWDDNNPPTFVGNPVVVDSRLLSLVAIRKASPGYMRQCALVMFPTVREPSEERPQVCAHAFLKPKRMELFADGAGHAVWFTGFRHLYRWGRSDDGSWRLATLTLSKGLPSGYVASSVWREGDGAYFIRWHHDKLALESGFGEEADRASPIPTLYKALQAHGGAIEVVRHHPWLFQEFPNRPGNIQRFERKGSHVVGCSEKTLFAIDAKRLQSSSYSPSPLWDIAGFATSPRGVVAVVDEGGSLYLMPLELLIAFRSTALRAGGSTLVPSHLTW